MLFAAEEERFVSAISPSLSLANISLFRLQNAIHCLGDGEVAPPAPVVRLVNEVAELVKVVTGVRRCEGPE